MMRRLALIMVRTLLIPRWLWWRLEDRLLGPVLLFARGVSCGKNVRLHGLPGVGKAAGASIVLGDRVCLRSRIAVNPLSARSCILVADRDGAAIEIGADVAISAATLVAAVGIYIVRGPWSGPRP